MLCLVRYLNLMIGHLIPRDNVYWKIYRVFRAIIGIVSAPYYVEAKQTYLKDLLHMFNTLVIHNFQDLTHKGHVGCHVPELMSLNGPLIHFWGMTFERKNRELKNVAINTNCTKNLPYTIGIRNQLHMSYVKESATNVQKTYSLGTIKKLVLIVKLKIYLK